MPTFEFKQYSCQNLQEDIDAYFGKNAPLSRTQGNISTLKWLLSPQNRRGFKRIDVESIPGKKRGIAFQVDLPFCFDVCALDPACDAPRVNLEPQDGELVFDLKEKWHICDANGDPMRLHFSEEDLEKYCQRDNMQHITDRISQLLYRFEEALNKRILQILAANVGRDTTNQTPTQIPLFVSSASNVTALNPDGLFTLNQTMADMNVEGNYAAIGGKIINKLAMHRKWTCCNDAGVNMSTFNPIDEIYPFYDRCADEVLGDTADFLALTPGAAQLVYWNKYRGDRARKVSNLYEKGTIRLPRTGLTVDYRWNYDYTCEHWYFEPFIYAELAVAPRGGCPGFENTNGILRFHDCSEISVTSNCPTNTFIDGNIGLDADGMPTAFNQHANNCATACYGYRVLNQDTGALITETGQFASSALAYADYDAWFQAHTAFEAGTTYTVEFRGHCGACDGRPLLDYNYLGQTCFIASA